MGRPRVRSKGHCHWTGKPMPNKSHRGARSILKPAGLGKIVTEGMLPKCRKYSRLSYLACDGNGKRWLRDNRHCHLGILNKTPFRSSLARCSSSCSVVRPRALSLPTSGKETVPSNPTRRCRLKSFTP